MTSVFWAEREAGKPYSVVEIDAITALLHRAYAPLGAAGMNYTAVDQDAAETRRRLAEGTTVIGRLNGEIVATGTVYFTPYTGPSIVYARYDTARFGQLAVDPKHQRKGFATDMLRRLEALAVKDNCTYLACDTAVPAAELQQFYLRRGYVVTERVRWPGKTYQSVILRKELPSGGRLR